MNEGRGYVLQEDPAAGDSAWKAAGAGKAVHVRDDQGGSG